MGKVCNILLTLLFVFEVVNICICEEKTSHSRTFASIYVSRDFWVAEGEVQPMPGDLCELETAEGDVMLFDYPPDGKTEYEIRKEDGYDLLSVNGKLASMIALRDDGLLEALERHKPPYLTMERSTTNMYTKQIDAAPFIKGIINRTHWENIEDRFKYRNEIHSALSFLHKKSTLIQPHYNLPEGVASKEDLKGWIARSSSWQKADSFLRIRFKAQWDGVYDDMLDEIGKVKTLRQLALVFDNENPLVDFNRLESSGIPEIEIACRKGTTFECVFPSDKLTKFQSVRIIGFGGIRSDDLLRTADICDRLTIQSARVMPSANGELHVPTNQSLILSLCDIKSDEGNQETLAKLILCAKDFRFKLSSIPHQVYKNVKSVLYVNKPRGEDQLDWMRDVFPNAVKFTFYCGFAWGKRTNIAKKSVPLDIAVPNGSMVYIRYADEYKSAIKGGVLVHEVSGECIGVANMSPAVEVKLVDRRK